MQLSDFHFELPPELIAQEPLAERSSSRLLVQTATELAHQHVSDLPELLRAGDHLVFNDTKVIPARLFGVKPTGGKLELLIERVIGENQVLTKIRASKALKAGGEFSVGGVNAVVIDRAEDLFRVEFELAGDTTIDSLLDAHGQLPLPPYIDRKPDETDAARYQTVYADKPGAVAAPTAGLHFDEPLFKALAKANITHSFVTLHVGAGTFMPVRVDDINEHKMHPERVEVSEECVQAIRKAKSAGGRVIAVGTTSVRSLEAAASGGELQAYNDETRLFITPGARFNIIDGMITNFHLPESTLLMLVSAFGGYENTMAAYRAAVAERYRFFSYGDAMLIWPDSTHASV